MLRRFVALLAWLSIAHLTFVGSDFSCATHSGSDSRMQHTMAHHTYDARSADQAREDGAPCQTPMAPVCCQGLTSCFSWLAVIARPSISRIARDGSCMLQIVSKIPPSEIVAPDPPPPRV